PRLCEYGQTGLSVVALGQRLRDTCNSNGNATGSDRCPTWVLLRCALIKPPGENSTPGSLKAVLVSLVKPVAYLNNRVMAPLYPGDGGGIDRSRLVAQRSIAVPGAAVATGPDGLRTGT